MFCKGTAFLASVQGEESKIYLKLRKNAIFLRIIEISTRKIENFTEIKHHLCLLLMSIFPHRAYTRVRGGNLSTLCTGCPFEYSFNARNL